MMRAKTLEDQITHCAANVEVDVGVLQQLAATMVDFDPRFEIISGTKARTGTVAHAEPYEAVPRKVIAE
jgi:linear primary-alkylsulfatase